MKPRIEIELTLHGGLPAKMVIEVPGAYVSARQAGRYFSKPEKLVRADAESGRLTGAKQTNGHWRIPFIAAFKTYFSDVTTETVEAVEAALRGL